jgi:hypothetical protein
MTTNLADVVVWVALVLFLLLAGTRRDDDKGAE